jgi:hypothetical protein
MASGVAGLMAGTLTIPLTDLAQGTYKFPANGGFALADGDTWATLTIDRTVAGGLNSLDASVQLGIEIDRSDDGGNTWYMIALTTMSGGVYQTKWGQLNSNQLAVSLGAGTGRQGRASVTVSGATTGVAGTFVLS